MIKFEINGKPTALDVDPNAPLLWVVREVIGLTGSKFGCGMGLCGACTMHLNGEPVRTCVLPVSAANGQRITTIEGVADGETLHPVQQAWVDENVPQCGYCQSGQIMSALALLEKNTNPSDKDIQAAMAGNICRCGTYPRIEKAIKRVINNKQSLQQGSLKESLINTSASSSNTANGVEIYEPAKRELPNEADAVAKATRETM
ncbi:(2Fe-2S)-binding protein [Thalassotalea euphylliae]|uniref:(2Fe-2S)-binding protein n=1 Tax=Thalassotalea euphylliae TaxID=1655234 RepID=A0A3E0U1G6_9GAMM|nr:(2Fe-2S)-binding protein [Thalassotalea euphylliae]REL30811.1 (2Fe-2S)-binding protein [Thalassotalea euphylliae]